MSIKESKWIAFVQGEWSSLVWVTEYSWWIAHPGQRPFLTRHYRHHRHRAPHQFLQIRFAITTVTRLYTHRKPQPQPIHDLNLSDGYSTSYLQAPPQHPMLRVDLFKSSAQLNHTLQSQKWEQHSTKSPPLLPQKPPPPPIATSNSVRHTTPPISVKRSTSPALVPTPSRPLDFPTKVSDVGFDQERAMYAPGNLQFQNSSATWHSPVAWGPDIVRT